MSDKIIYITFRDYKELKEYTQSIYAPSYTDEPILLAILKSINGNEKYGNEKRILKPVDESKLIFRMNLPNDDTLVEDPVFGYRIVLQSIYPTIAPKRFFAKGAIPETENNIVKMYFAIPEEIHERYIIHRIDDKEFIKVISINGTKIDCPYPINISYDSTYVNHMNNNFTIYTIDVSKKYLNFKIAHDDYMHINSRYDNDIAMIFLRRSIDKLFQNDKEETEKKEPINNLNETFTFVNGAGFKNKKYNSSILFDVLALYPKKETNMTKIKDIKLNGPATILFTTDNKKVVVKCRPGDNYDPEKGILMVLCKYIYNSNTDHNNWTEIFDIPYKDEIDVEKVIAMSIVKDYFYRSDKDWHYNYVLKYMYNAVNLQTEDRVKALKALNYSVERIARCLGITKGLVKDILETKDKTVWETAKENFLSYLDRLKKVSTDNKPKITVTGTKDPYIESLLKEKPELKNNNNPYEVPDHKPCNMEEKDVITDQNIIDLFNKGYSISKISKELGLTEYFVKKYLDAYTNPKTEKKADKILKKAVKNSKKEKKSRGGYHKRLTEIAFPSYLTKEESEDILEKTKVKYEGKYKCMSELQKYFDRECKHFAINKFYGNGYSAFELGQMLGVSAAAIMRMRNNPI